MKRLSPHELSQRYITNRFLPDKAIDLMDEALKNMYGNQF
jgi:ATP-dependent Clp protease ATP-binding subunit ClpA